MTVSPGEVEQAKRAYSIVGELILITSALDQQLNRICISLLGLTDSPMLEPLVASLDISRKLEILKSYASTITTKQWRKGIKDHAEAIETVNRARNIAAHSVLSFENGVPVLQPLAAAKLFKAINLKNKTVVKTQFSFLEEAVRKAEAARESGANLLDNLERIAAEGARLMKGT